MEEGTTAAVERLNALLVQAGFDPLDPTPAGILSNPSPAPAPYPPELPRCWISDPAPASPESPSPSAVLRSQ
jgi:hypothetical protein